MKVEETTVVVSKIRGKNVAFLVFVLTLLALLAFVAFKYPSKLSSLAANKLGKWRQSTTMTIHL